MLILIFTLLNINIAIFSSFVTQFFTKNSLYEQGFSDNSPLVEFVIAVLFVPFFETFLYQFAVIEILYKKCSKILLCFLSAFFFSLSHSYSLYYIAFTFFMGLSLAYLYVLGKPKNRSFIMVFAVHLIYNLIVFILSHAE